MAKKQVPLLTKISDDIKNAAGSYITAKANSDEAKAQMEFFGETVREFGISHLGDQYGVVRMVSTHDDRAIEFQRKSPALKTLHQEQEEQLKNLLGDKYQFMVNEQTNAVRFEIDVDPAKAAETLGPVMKALTDANLPTDMVKVVYHKDIRATDRLRASFMDGSLEADIGDNAEQVADLFGWDTKPRTSLRVVAATGSKAKSSDKQEAMPDMSDLAKLGLKI